LSRTDTCTLGGLVEEDMGGRWLKPETRVVVESETSLLYHPPNGGGLLVKFEEEIRVELGRDGPPTAGPGMATIFACPC